MSRENDIGGNSPQHRLDDRIEAIADRFALDWERGENPQLETYLDQVPARKGELFARLLPIEYRARHRRGDLLTREQCLRRFARFRSEIDRIFLDPTFDSVPDVRHDASTEDQPVRLTAFECGSVATGLFSDPTKGLITDEVNSGSSLPRIDRYEILSEIGRGGMGVVYRARDTKHQQTLALKTMLRVDPGSLSRFKKEFRARAGIHHPNLVRLHELVVAEQFSYFTMEFVEGRDFLRALRGDLAAGKPFPNERLDKLDQGLRQICGGLIELHASGKVHRDIKSNNILLTDTGRVVIVDFGLAIELEYEGAYQTIDGHVIGTPSYMSPEQAEGAAVTPATDWYSVGVLLYAVLTGHLPFEGSPAEVIRRKRTEDPLPIDRRVDGVSPKFSHICMQLLARDPDRRADGQWVLKELGAPMRPMRSRQSDQPFVGRDSELKTLSAAFGQLHQRVHHSYFVQGLSGSGKSKLVARFIEQVRSHSDVLVLKSRCYGQESIPFKAIDELIEGLSRYLQELTFEQVDAWLPRDIGALAQVFPTLRQVDAIRHSPLRSEIQFDRHTLRKKAFLALREMLARIGDRRRLLLVIDDLQWSDDDSLLLLNHLLRGPDPPNLLFVGVFRDEEFRETVFNTITKSVPSCHRMQLNPLSRRECEELFGLMVPRWSDQQGYAELRSKVAAESMGSPLFLHELVLAITERDESLARSGDVTLDGIMWGRIERLPEDPRQLLEALAVAGQPMSPGDLAGIANVSALSVTESIELLRSQSLARECGGDEEVLLDTFHDRVREVILARLTENQRCAFHRDIVEYCQSHSEPDAYFLAVHHRFAGNFKESAHYYALSADDAAEKLAFHQAAELYHEAIELRAAESEQDDTQLRIKFAEALSNSGQCLQAAEVYLEVADGCDGPTSVEMRRRAFAQFQFMGQIGRARDVLKVLCQQVGREVPASIPGALVLTGLANLKISLVRWRKRRQVDPTDGGQVDAFWSIASAMTHVDLVRSSYYTAQHLLEAEKLGDPPRLARALALEAGMIASLGRITRRHSLRLSRRADSLANAMDDHYLNSSLALCRGIRSGCLGEWAKSLQECREAETMFVDLRHSSAIRNSNESHEILGNVTLAQFWQLLSMSWLGEIEQLDERCDRLIDEAIQRHDLFTSVMLGGYCRSFLRVAKDRPIDGIRELQSTMREWDDGGFYIQHHLAIIGEATLRLYRGDPEGAVALIRGHRRRYRQSWLLGAHIVRAQLNDLLTRAALAKVLRTPSGRRWWRHAKRTRRRLAWERLPWTSALSVAYRGTMRLLRHDRVRAARDLTSAAERFDSLGMSLHAAASRARLADTINGDSGLQLREQAYAEISGRGVVRPEAFAIFLLPGPTDVQAQT